MTDDPVNRARAAILDKFLAVSAERIERLNSCWIALERDAGDTESLESALRDIHTIKGEARIMGFGLASTVAHRLEDLMLHAQKHAFADVPVISERVLEGFDVLGDLLAVDPPPRLQHSAEAFVAAVTATLEALTASSGGATIQTQHDQEVGIRRPLGQSDWNRSDVSPFGLQQVSTASAALIPNKPSSAQVPAALAAAAGGGAALEGPQQKPKSSTVPAARSRISSRPADDAQRRFARVPRMRLDHLTEYLGEVQRGHHQSDASLIALQELNAASRRILAMHAPSRDDWLELSKLQKRVSVLLQAARDEALLGASQLDEVNAVLRRLRLLPLSTLFNRFERLVRDLAKQQHKNIRFTMAGGELEADANVLDELAEPMLHLVQNCIDHGIESPDARRKAGKSGEAQLRLEATLAGSGVEIRVIDDGRGIDREAVGQAAVRRGLLSADELRDASDDDIFRLIFASGLSTRLETTELSGRGVGMDVVRRKVENLGGRISVHSIKDEGTTFAVFVPTSAAVSRMLVVSAGGARFAFPSHAVAIIAEAEPQTWIDAGGGIALRLEDEVVPLASLGQLVGAETAPNPRGERVVVVTDGDRSLGLLVDRVHAETQLVRRPLGELLGGMTVYLGAGVGDAGEPILIVNLTELMRRSGVAPALRARVDQRAAKRRAQTVMLVDDSEITRDMFERIIRAQGYRTVEAADGREALAKLATIQPDLIITDLEMPEMSGFQLIEVIRRSEGSRRTPIVVLSSLGSDQDKERAANLGADAHLVKTDFTRALLVETVERFLQ